MGHAESNRESRPRQDPGRARRPGAPHRNHRCPPLRHRAHRQLRKALGVRRRPALGLPGHRIGRDHHRLLPDRSHGRHPGRQVRDECGERGPEPHPSRQERIRSYRTGHLGHRVPVPLQPGRLPRVASRRDGRDRIRDRPRRVLRKRRIPRHRLYPNRFPIQRPATSQLSPKTTSWKPT